MGSGDDCRLPGEEGRQRAAAEEGQRGHDHTGGKGRLDAIEQGFFGAVILARAVILRHKGGDGLHIGRADQHQKANRLLGHAHGGGLGDAHAVDHHLDEEEGELHQHLLECDGDAHPQNGPDVDRVEPDIEPVEGERQLLPADQDQRDDDADGLGRDRGDGRAGSAQMEDAHQHQVAHDVDDAGDGHGQQRRFGIADSAEDGSDDVIGYDKHRADAADAHIAAGLGEGLRRSVQQRGQAVAPGDHDGGDRHGDDGENGDARSDAPASPLRVPGADGVAHQDRDAHGEAGDDQRHQMKELAAGSHAGLLAGSGELAHNNEVRRAVHDL